MVTQMSMSVFPVFIGQAGIWSWGEVLGVPQQGHRSRPHGASMTAKTPCLEVRKGPSGRH